MNRDRILLESGTNELEIVEFSVFDGEHTEYYGVNVCKVKEILRRTPLTSVASAPPALAGMMCLRDKIIPVIDLALILGVKEQKPADKIIVLEFNRTTVGVLVHSVSRIYRLSWEQVEQPPHLGGGNHVTGLVKMADRIILLLDFELIVSDLVHESALSPLSKEDAKKYSHPGRKVLLVDDSKFIRNSISSTLRNAGYEVEEASNGEIAWEMINQKINSGNWDLDLIITDIEMPHMDGLHLTSLIRKDERAAYLKNVPVFIFSSLANSQNNLKWENIGANGILTKPDLPRLIAIISDALAPRNI